MPRKTRKSDDLREVKVTRVYTDAEVDYALECVATNHGNISRTAAQLGIPAATLSNWVSGRSKGHLRGLLQPEPQRYESLASELESVAWRLAAALPEKIERAGLSQVAMSLGIAIDKMRLLRDQATQINQVNAQVDVTSLTDEQLAVLEEIARQIGANVAQTPVDPDAKPPDIPLLPPPSD